MTFQKLCMVRLLVVGLSFLLTKSMFGQGRNQPPDLGALSDAELKTVTIRFERTPCYGTCPAYTVTIHGDGRVEYDGKSRVKETRAREGRIDTENLRELVLQFRQMKFWNVAEDYSATKCHGRVCTDMPTALTELTVKGATNRVNHYYGCGSAPKSLFDLESAIDKTVNSQQWTGYVSKAGPFGTTCWEQN